MTSNGLNGNDFCFSENPRRDQQDYRAPAIDWSAIHARHEIDKVKKWEGRPADIVVYICSVQDVCVSHYNMSFKSDSCNYRVGQYLMSCCLMMFSNTIAYAVQTLN